MIRQNVPFVSKAQNLALAVIVPTRDQRKDWDACVQPYAERPFGLELLTASALNVPLSNIHGGDVRADIGWRWGEPFSSISLSERLGTWLGQQPRCYMLVSINGSSARPLGMVLLAENFAWFEENKSCVFIWYLSDACPEYFSATEQVRPKPLAKLLLDIAVCRSFHVGHEGRVLLHAAPQGGERLTDWYKDSCGMSCVDSSVTRISKARANDGRFYFFDEQSATSFSESLDNHRLGGVS